MIRWSDDEREALEDERRELQTRLRYLDVLLSGTPDPDQLLDETVRILRIPGAAPRAGRPGVPALNPRVAEAVAEHLEHPDSVTVTEQGGFEGSDEIGSDR
jgi:hypothetical protein